MRRKGRIPFTVTFIALALAMVAAGARAEPSPEPATPPPGGGTESPVQANVIVPHAAEPATGKEVTSSELAQLTSDETIELMDVGEVVEIPTSARRSMFAENRMLPDNPIAAADRDGNLIRYHAGTWTSSYISDDNRIVIAGVTEKVGKGEAQSTRPVLVITLKTREESFLHQRYPLSVKSTRTGQSGIEPGMELRGGVKAVSEGTSPDTYDVYLELVTKDQDAKPLLVRGTFENSSIPCLKKKDEKKPDRQ